MRVLHGLFLCPVLCLAQTAAPVISFSKTHHDFGRVLQGNKVSYKYEVTNKGNAPLQIKEVRPSCGCTYTMVGQGLLKPGENTFIEAQFDSAGMVGSIHKFLEVISNDPSNPNTLLNFDASIICEIMSSASLVLFSEISRFSTSSSTIRLESGNERPVVVTDIKIAVPYISSKTQQEGNDVILNVTINGRLIPKQSNYGMETLIVHTTNEMIPRLQFIIQWDALSTITASHKRIIWNDFAGKELRTTVSLSHSGGKPFKILGIESTSPFIKAINLSKNSVTEHKLDVIMTAEAKAGMYHEKIILKLDDSEQKELEIAIATVLR